MPDAILIHAHRDVEYHLDFQEARTAPQKSPSTPIARFSIKFAIGLLIIMTFVLPLAFLINPNDQPPEKLKSGLFAVVPTLAILWAWVGIHFSKGNFSRWLIRRALAKNPSLASPIRWTIGDDEIEIHTPQMDSRTRWSAFTKTVERSNGFVMYQGTIPWCWLPATGFSSHGEIQRFAEIARKCVPVYIESGTCRPTGKPPSLPYDDF